MNADKKTHNFSSDLNKKERIIWIDVCRGIGIILVMLGHTSIPVIPYRLIYGFHLPLFFVLTGYLFALSHHNEIPFGAYLKKLFFSYLLPYFILCSINLVFSFAGYKTGIIRDFSLSQHLLGIFIYSWGTREWLPNCSPLWFLTCLFVALAIFYWIMRCRNRIVRTLFILLCMTISYTLDLLDAPKLYWNIDSAMMAVVFLSIGALLYKRNVLKVFDSMQALPRWIIIAFCIILGCTTILFNDTVSFNFNDYGILPLMLIGAILLCFVVFKLSILAEELFQKHLTYFISIVGKHTLFIMGFDYVAWGIASIVSDKWYIEFLIKCLILLISGFVYHWIIKHIKNAQVRSVLDF